MKTSSNKTSTNENRPALCRSNWLIIITACLLIVAGLVLMAGSGSTSETFNTDIFSTRRVVVAPLLCLSGYLLVVVGICWPGAKETRIKAGNEK